MEYKTVSRAPSSANDCGSSGGDACAAVLAFMIARLHFRRNTLSNNLGLPFLVVEECIRNNESSSILRKQLLSYLLDNGSVFDKIPPTLLSQLQADCSRDENNVNDTELSEYPMSALDNFSRKHFTRLQNSVGQGFISILSNPADSVDIGSSNISSWLGGKIYDALDYNGSASAPQTVGDRLQQYKQSVLQKPDSSVALLTEHPVRSDFSEYVKMISGSYQANASESRGGLGYLESLDSAKETLPWPKDVPDAFFQSSFDPSAEVKVLAPSASVTLSLSEPTGDVSNIVSSTSFNKDFEYLEKRLKELRVYEESVESCLLKHVQSKSEDFFTSTSQFENLEGEARLALADMREVKYSGVVNSLESIKQFLSMGVLYRRRKNCDTMVRMTTKVQSIFEFASTVENWISLPERDLAELATFLDKVALLESFVKGENKTDELSGLTLDSFSKVKCLSQIEDRVKIIREGMEALVRQLIGDVITQSNSERTNKSSDATSISICKAAAMLNVLPGALTDYIAGVTREVWRLTLESTTTLLLNSGSLNDTKADQFLSAVSSVSDGRKEREKVLSFVNECGFDVFMRILSSLVQAMSDHFSSVVLRWVVSVSNVLYPSLQFYTERDTLVSTKTVELCQSLLAEEDSIVCLLIVSRAERRPFSSVEEIERCAQMAYRLRGAAVEFFSRLQHEAPTGPVTNCLSHFSYPPTAVQAAITRHARNYFKLQHARQLEKLTLVLESETWNAKESIDPIFQSYLQTLCGSSEKDVAVFDELAISEQNLVHHAARRNRAKSTAVNRGEDDLLGSMANKLYVSLDGDSDGRIVCDSTLILIELLQSYDTFLGQFPILSFEVTSRTLELISLYDSYTANLILNAEAVKKGTLSTITINNVCIASQPLALLLDFLPLWQQRIMATLRLRSTPSENTPTEESKAATKHTKVESFLENEITTVKKSLKLHREQCLGRASTVVLRKVNSLEAMEKGMWSSKGNEWVMTMLREVARLLRAVKPLLPTGDSHGVVIPLIRALSLKIKEITASIPATETASRELASSDLILFKVNVEKFGYDVLAAVDKGVVETAIAAPSAFKPSSTDDEVLKWFFEKDDQTK